MMDLEKVETLNEAEVYIRGVLNDYEAGLATKDQTLGHLGKYTARIMEVFWDNTKPKIERAFVAGRSKTSWEQYCKENPELS